MPSTEERGPAPSRRRLSWDCSMQLGSPRPLRPGNERRFKWPRATTTALAMTGSRIRTSVGKHAHTHDVRREEATNSAPKVAEPDEFANDLANDNR